MPVVAKRLPVSPASHVTSGARIVEQVACARATIHEDVLRHGKSVANEATLEEWQHHKNPDESVNRILKLAKKLGLPHNIPLLPRLRALAKANVLAFNRKF